MEQQGAATAIENHVEEFSSFGLADEFLVLANGFCLAKPSTGASRVQTFSWDRTQVNLIGHIEIRARFWLILRWTSVFAIALLAIGLFIAWLGDHGESRHDISTDQLIDHGAQILGWGAVGILAFSGLLYAICWLVRVRVDRNEICGRTYWGSRVRFPSNSVTAVEATRYQGVRYLWVSSSATSKQLCLVMLGVSPDEYIEDLSRILGDSHRLTKWFAANAEG